MYDELFDLVQSMRTNLRLAEDACSIVLELSNANDAMTARLNGFARVIQNPPAPMPVAPPAPVQATVTDEAQWKPEVKTPEFASIKTPRVTKPWGELLSEINKAVGAVGRAAEPAPPVPQRTVVTR